MLLRLELFLFFLYATAENQKWTSFKLKYDKLYKTTTENQEREMIFEENLKKIEDHNKQYEQGLVSYQLGVNQFADLTAAEFASLLTLKIDQRNSTQTKSNVKHTRVEIPESIDWRSKGVVTPVKDQKNCGACWAFSTTGTVESLLAIKTGKLVSLSEQELIDCNSYNYGCNGGVVQGAILYISNSGLKMNEKTYPYLGVKGSCKAVDSGETIFTSAYININQGDENDLKNAVGSIGPVSVAIDATPVQLYTKGILDPTSCTDNVNHAVLAVGYGTSDDGTQYWIMKNSWGTVWGEDGYFRLKMGSNLCGITRQSCYAVFSDPDPVDPTDNKATYYLIYNTLLWGLCFLHIRLLL